MSATTTLNLVFPQESERDKAEHLSTLDIEPKIFALLNAFFQPSSEVSAAIAAQEITNHPVLSNRSSFATTRYTW